MKFFQKRGVALTVMLLMIAVSIAWGLYKKPASLPNVKYETWIYDGAGLLSAQTERMLERYNDNWDSSYRALCAVATVKSVKGWDLDEYTAELGERWGLGARDLLLVLVDAKDGPTWYMNGGDEIMELMSGQYQNSLSSGLDAAVYTNRWDDAASGAFETINGMYASYYGIGGYVDYGSGGEGWQSPQSGLGLIWKFLLVLLAVIVIWVIIDRLRYNRYRRRCLAPGMGTPTVRYTPIFFGRSLYSPRTSAVQRRPTVSSPRPSGTTYRPSSGTS
ncbi:MAG: TPM domain-containing protein, partial [Oscillospiraceae bacterium]|nr:TPM domain-containing protein [Oscillospiraceae bacterium]